MIHEPGVYDMAAETYHADPAPEPSLSASAADQILKESARHCWSNHPALNPTWEDLQDKGSSGRMLRMEHGSALHRMILGAGREVVEVPADNYTTKAAKEARAAAREANQIPVLSGDLVQLKACADAVREQIAAHPDLGPVMRGPGKAEQAMLWRERIGSPKTRNAPMIWCRALVDWMPQDPRAPLIDFKFTSMSAAPESYSRTVRDSLTLRSAHYLRGAQAVRGVAPRAYWIVACEVDAPFGLSVHRAGNDLLHEARDQWAESAARFYACLSKGHERHNWPFWTPAVHVAEMPAWRLQEWENKKALEEIPRAKAGISAQRARSLQQQIGGPIA